MAITINNIKLKINEPKSSAIEKAVKLLKVSSKDVDKAVISKTSLDARKQDNILVVCSVCVKLNTDEKTTVEKLLNPNIKYQEELTPIFEYGDEKLEQNPFVIGFGPAGMFAALVLAQNGYAPIVLERGMAIDERVKCVENFWNNSVLNSHCNVQFGEGGAGTFSDGKLTTRINNPLNSYVLKEFVRFGAPTDILFKAKPHIGTDLLRGIVKKIREEIIKLGGKVCFSTSLEDIEVTNGKLTKIKFNGEWHIANNVILSIGHSARDTFSMLKNNDVYIENKPFSVGVRIEHLQSEIDKGLYGKQAGNPLLPCGEYQLSYKFFDKAAYTFCMCPGGVVVPSSSEENAIVTNGMSEYARDKANANSALVVSVDNSDFGNNWDSGINFQRKLEQSAYNCSNSYKAPCQTVGNFLNNKKGCDFNRILPSYQIGITDADFNNIFPENIVKMMKDGLLNFDKKINGFATADAVMTGVETRTSSPVRIKRKENGQSVNVEGIYPCGEGAGYAGGIMSAAIDGITMAKEIMKIYKPMD